MERDGAAGEDKASTRGRLPRRLSFFMRRFPCKAGVPSRAAPTIGASSFVVVVSCWMRKVAGN